MPPVDLLPKPLPFLTAGLPGLGGTIKILPEDFVVEELPETIPAGEGDHLYLWIEKRGRETPEVAKALAQALSVSPRDVGYAGLKDRQALTRQWFSVPMGRSSNPGGAGGVPTEGSALASALPAGAFAFEMPGARVLSISRHTHKLRTGALRGNRFWIKLRGIRARAALGPLLRVLRDSGVPNWFGPQRFGRRGDNAALGAALIGVGLHPLAERARRDGFLRRLALSALQSELFNRLLAARVSEGRLAELEIGDVLLVPEDRRPLVARDGSLAARVASFEARVTGPMFGSRMLEAQGAPGNRERRVLEESGLRREVFARGGDELRGTRRPYRFELESVDVREDPDGLVLSFDLPSGGYATSVLRELIGPPPRDAGEGRVGAASADLGMCQSPDDAPEGEA